MAMKNKDKLPGLSPTEAARVAEVAVGTIYKAIKDNDIAYRRCKTDYGASGKYRIRLEDLHRWILQREERKKGPQTDANNT